MSSIQNQGTDRERLPHSNVKDSIDMFNIDYEAGSNALMSNHVDSLRKLPAAHRQGDRQFQSIQPGDQRLAGSQAGAQQRGTLVLQSKFAKAHSNASEHFDDAVNAFNAHYEASMIELASFKDSQSKVVTDNSCRRQSGKILSSEQESSDGQLTDFQRATGQRILTKGPEQRVLSNRDVLASRQKIAPQGSGEPARHPMSNDASGLAAED